MNAQMRTSVLDLKGLVMESYHSGVDPDAIEGGIKPLVNTAGFGLVTFLSKYYEPILQICESPLNMVACLDLGNKYRKGLLTTYKANRSKKEADPVEKEQINLAINMAKSFLLSQGATLVACKDEEADDVVGYLVTHLEGMHSVHTVDRDLIALSGPNTHVFIKGKVISSMVDKEVEVPANLVTLYKSIVGDTSDNYGGVKGVGPKGWVDMVEAFGEDGMLELDDLINSRNKAKILATAEVADNKVFSKCAQAFDVWQNMYKVARISPEIVTPVWVKRAPEKERLVNVFKEANCEDLVHKYERDTYRATLVTSENLEECMSKIDELLSETPFVPWDYETYDAVQVPEFKEAVGARMFVDMLNSKIAGCSFAFGRNVNEVFYFSVDHKDTANVDKENITQVLRWVKDAGLDLVAQNVAFESTISKVQLGYDIHSYEDTKLYSHHIDENTENGLKYNSKVHLNYDQVSYADTLSEFGAKDMSDISGENVLSYGADDSMVTGHMYSHFVKLTSIEGTRNFIRQYECPAVEALVDAHIRGANLALGPLKEMAEADEIVLAKNMKLIRATLEKHCSNPNFEGVDVLFKDQSNYVKAKASERKGSTEETVQESVSKFKQTLKSFSFYEKQAEVKTFKPFVATPSGLTKVAQHLNLPQVQKTSRAGITDYIEDVRADEGLVLDPTDKMFLQLIPPAWSGFKDRVSPQYKQLEDFCNKVLEEHAPVVLQGTELNLNSPNQNQYLFYILLGLPIRLRTKVQPKSTRQVFGLEGSPATDGDAIQSALANDCEGENSWKREVLELLLEYKAASTRKKIYWDVYPLWAEGDKNGYIHPNFNSCGTVTRRPTGSNPNLLQIAKGDVRSMFIPASEDNVICSIDFSSQELRLNADACQDPTWMSAYSGEGKDLHALTGCRVVSALLAKAGKCSQTVPELMKVVVGMHEGEVTEERVFDETGAMDYGFFKAHIEDKSELGKWIKKARSTGKTVNFSVQFGSGPATLGRQLLVPDDEAATYIKAYNETFPYLQVWKDKTILEAKQKEYSSTSYGNRRHCKGINGRDRTAAGKWQRQVCNFKIQGTASDILKIVLTGITNTGILKKHGAYLLAPIYDEVLLEIPKKSLKAVIDGVSDLMSLTVPGGTIPMVPDASFGSSWAAQVEVGTKPSQETIDKALKEV